MGTIWEQPSPSDLEAILADIRGGMGPYDACRKNGGWTCSKIRAAMKRDPEFAQAYAEACVDRQEAMTQHVDVRVEQLVQQDNPAPPIVALWAKRHSPEYRQGDRHEIEHGGTVDVRTDIAEAIDRFTQAVSAAAVRHAAGARAELDAGEPVTGGAGRVGVPVAGVAGPS